MAEQISSWIHAIHFGWEPYLELLMITLEIPCHMKINSSTRSKTFKII